MLGEFCALGAALTWSVSVILFKRSEAISPFSMNLFKNAVAFILLMLTLVALQIAPAWERSSEDWLRLIVSGVLGIAVADTLIFMALRRLGAGMLAVVDCIYAPTIVVLSVLVLGEQLSTAFVFGVVCVVVGVLLSTTEQEAEAEQGAAEEPKSGRAAGVALGVAGIVAMAVGVILAKPALDDGNLVEVTQVRLIAGLIAQGVWLAFLPDRREILAVFRETKVWRTLLPASILGTYIAMLLWMGGFKWAPVSTASVLNQLASVFTLLLAWIFLEERLSLRRAFGTLLAVAGAAAVLWTRMS